ncbi:MAG: hypothetical protein ACE5IA_02720 [Dehalococcoidia bacterium]
MKSGKLTPWLMVSALLVVLFVGYSIYAGLPIKKIGIPGVFSVEFGEKPTGFAPKEELSKLNVVEREESQARLQEQLSALEQKLDELKPGSGAAVSESEPPQEGKAKPTEGAATAKGRAEPALPVDVTGKWHDAEGSSLVFEQVGNYVVFQELDPLFGILAAGEGTINGNVINLSIVTVLGEALTSNLEVSVDGQSMRGTVTSPLYGETVDVELFR